MPLRVVRKGAAALRSLLSILLLAEAEAVECRRDDSPEEMFQREWRRQIFALAIEDLRRHCDDTGKQLQFHVFESYDLADDERPSYAGLAERLGLPITTLNNHLAWARRMLRGFVAERLAASPAAMRSYATRCVLFSPRRDKC